MGKSYDNEIQNVGHFRPPNYIHVDLCTIPLIGPIMKETIQDCRPWLHPLICHTFIWCYSL